MSDPFAFANYERRLHCPCCGQLVLLINVPSGELFPVCQRCGTKFVVAVSRNELQVLVRNYPRRGRKLA